MNLPDDELFAAAIELDGLFNQREFILRNASDSRQEDKVLRLLERHHQLEVNPNLLLLNRAEDLLNSYTERADVQPGTKIGKYEIVEQIGEGGMGIVYRAQQVEPLKRTVALKLLKPGMDSNRILHRFALERQILERMEHPGVTRILDAGLQPNGRPFFAMELIENNSPITEFAKFNGLDIASRVQLIIDICEVIQHAHQKGVIHRDLKPSNLLITETDGQPVVKVIDFGIAKAVDDSFELSNITTQLGERLGTPAYMSPEYFRKSKDNIDVRSDVYSLGVVLGELLTGVTPEDATSFSESSCHSRSDSLTPSALLKSIDPDDLEMLAQNCQTSTRALNRILTGELDWICAKATAADRSDRYQTVSDLKQDLESFLEGKPVSAAKPSVFYQAKKIVARNLVLSAVIATSLVGIVSVAAIACWFAYQANLAETKARIAENQARQHLQEVMQVRDNLVEERNRANEANLKIRAFWKQQSVSRAFIAATIDYYEKLIKRSDENTIPGAGEPFAFFDPTLCLDLSFLNQSHPDLVIKSDWSWVHAKKELGLAVETLRLSSERLVEFANNRKNQNPLFENIADIKAKKVANARFHRARVQKLVLASLAEKLEPTDPLIAEGLDNCGAEHLAHQEYEQAAELFEKSTTIWGCDGSFPERLTQAELFLSHCLFRLGQDDQGQQLRQNAVGRLESGAIAQPERLMELARKFKKAENDEGIQE